MTALKAAQAVMAGAGPPRPGDPDYMLGELARTIFTGLLDMGRRRQLSPSLTATSLAFIDWYRASDRWTPCPTGHLETHCSEYARQVITRRGPLLGWLLAAGRVDRCRRAQGFRLAWAQGHTADGTALL